MRTTTDDVLSEVLVETDRELLNIPIGQIKVYANQPRQEFDEEELNGLADSIEEVGQRTAITVRPINDGQFNYELVDGERRLRACQMRGKPTILALVEKIDSEGEQFMRSVVANFCRAAHTPLETAEALQRILEWICQKNPEIPKREALEKAAKACGRSYSWATQNLGLLNLCPEVRELMKEKKIPRQIGVALTSLKPEHQISFAHYIIKKGLDFKPALNYIRIHTEKVHLAGKGRQRRGNKNYDYFRMFVQRFGRDLEMMSGMFQAKKKELFTHRSASEINELVMLVSAQTDYLKEIQSILKKVIIEKENTEKAIAWAQSCHEAKSPVATGSIVQAPVAKEATA